MKSIGVALCAATAAFAITSIFAAPASAAYVIKFEQVGSNVVATGSGSINVSGMTYTGNTFFNTPFASYVAPYAAQTFIGTGKVDKYAGVSGASTWGAGPFTPAWGGQTGAGVSLRMQDQSIWVPLGYVSGTDLGISTATYTNTDFATLGLTSGTYVYTFGQGATADTFTIEIPGAVPEPSTWAMMLIGFGAIGASMRRRKVGYKALQAV